MKWNSPRLAAAVITLAMLAVPVISKAQAALPGQAEQSGEIQNVNSNKCLDVTSWGRNSGGNVQQWDCNGNANQVWQLQRVQGGNYAIVNQNSGMVLDVTNRSAANGANVQQYQWSSVPNQEWKLRPAGAGSFAIVSVASGKCLDVTNASMDKGANIQQWDCTNAPNQLFRITPASASAGQGANQGQPVSGNQGIGPNYSNPAQEQAERAVQIVGGPNVMPVGGGNANLHWTTNDIAATHVKYGTDPNNLTQDAYHPGGAKDHQVTLTNLQPGQTYYYHILTRDGDVRYTGQFQASPR